MKNSIFRSGPNVGPVLSWLISQMDDSATLEKRLRGALLNRGIQGQHWRGVRALDSEANGSIVEMLEEGLEGEEHLAVLSVIGQCQLQDGEVGLTELQVLAEVLVEVSPSQVSNAAYIVRKWLRQSSYRDPDELKCVLRWCLSSGVKKAPKGRWDALLVQTAKSFFWSLPFDFPTEIDGVVILPLTDGQALAEEGSQMANCLGRLNLFEYARRASHGELLFFHLHRRRSPLTCATLSIELDDEKSWSISEFETVGSGRPPASLKCVAKKLEELLNAFSGRIPDDLDALGDAFDNCNIPSIRRRRVRRPQMA